MSYAGLVVFGADPPASSCADYTVRADGRCLDDDGNFFPALDAPIGSDQKWYHRPSGKCVDPPPIVCDVNADNLPPSCPPQMEFDAKSPTGCSLSQANVTRTTLMWFAGGALAVALLVKLDPLNLRGKRRKR